MKRIILSLLAFLAFGAQAEVWNARYGVAEVFNFKLYNADGTLDVDEADGGTEVSLSCNEGAQATATNDFVDEGDFYSISLTATEMQCERIAVVVAATTTEVFFVQTHSNASALTPQFDANVTQFGGSAGTFASGVPAVNATQVSGDATAADNLELVLDDTAGAVPWIGIVDQGTAQSATATTVVLRAASAFGDDTLVGRTICVLGSTQAYWQCGAISDSVLATDTVTVPTWAVTPSGTITYKVWGTAAGSGSVTVAAGGITASSFAAGAIDATAIATAAIDADALATDTITGSKIAADSIGASELATDAIGAAEIASGTIGAAEIGTAAIDADAIATDAIGALEIATDAIGPAEVAADTIAASELAATAVDEVRDMVVEDQGSISLGCAIAALLAVDAGDVSTTGGNSTFEEASGLETRVTSVVVSAGNRTVTITCPTY